MSDAENLKSAEKAKKKDVSAESEIAFDVEKIVSSAAPLKSKKAGDEILEISQTPKKMAAAEDILEIPELQTKKPKSKKTAEIIEAKTLETETAEIKTEKVENAENAESAVFRALANPVLPKRAAENRAYLQMQSPTRAFFYWSVKEASFETLFRALGNRAQGYGIGIKLVNLSENSEMILPAEMQGSHWFNVAADSKYRAEVGFFAPNRPFIRVIFSNELQTPRSAPSPNTDYQPYFAVTAVQFAEVLDSAGYNQDAFEVFIAGDDAQESNAATREAISQISGGETVDFSSVMLNELRYALFALASGVTLSSLQNSISERTFDFLSGLTANNANVLSEENVVLALENFFGFSPVFEEFTTEETTYTPAFVGGSLVNLGSKPLTKIRMTPQSKRFFDKSLNPMSSFVLR